MWCAQSKYLLPSAPLFLSRDGERLILVCFCRPLRHCICKQRPKRQQIATSTATAGSCRVRGMQCRLMIMGTASYYYCRMYSQLCCGWGERQKQQLQLRTFCLDPSSPLSRSLCTTAVCCGRPVCAPSLPLFENVSPCRPDEHMYSPYFQR